MNNNVAFLVNGSRYCDKCGRLFNELEQKYFKYCPECGSKIFRELKETDYATTKNDNA